MCENAFPAVICSHLWRKPLCGTIYFKLAKSVPMRDFPDLVNWWDGARPECGQHRFMSWSYSEWKKKSELCMCKHELIHHSFSALDCRCDELLPVLPLTSRPWGTTARSCDLKPSPLSAACDVTEARLPSTVRAFILVLTASAVR